MSQATQATAFGATSWKRKGSVKCALKTKAAPWGRKTTGGGGRRRESLDEQSELQAVLAGRKKKIQGELEETGVTQATVPSPISEENTDKSFNPKSWKKKFESTDSAQNKPFDTKQRPSVASKPKPVTAKAGVEANQTEVSGNSASTSTSQAIPNKLKGNLWLELNQADSKNKDAGSLKSKPGVPAPAKKPVLKTKSSPMSPPPKTQPKPAPRRLVSQDLLAEGQDQAAATTEDESPTTRPNPPWAGDLKKPNVPSKPGKPAPANLQAPTSSSAAKLKAMFEAADSNNNKDTVVRPLKPPREFNKAPPPPKPAIRQRQAKVTGGESEQSQATSDVVDAGHTTGMCVVPSVQALQTEGADCSNDSGHGSVAAGDEDDDDYLELLSEDEGWEDEEEGQEDHTKKHIHQHLLKLSSKKASVHLRHSADGTKRRHRRNQVSKSRWSNPEHKSSSVEYDDVATLSGQDEWETDESEGSDLYEEVEDAISKSCPQTSYLDKPPLPAQAVLPTQGSRDASTLPSLAKQSKHITKQGSEPQLTNVGLEPVPPLPERTVPRVGDHELLQKVPPPRPPPPLFPRGSKGNVLDGLSSSPPSAWRETTAPALPSRSNVPAVAVPTLPPRNPTGQAAKGLHAFQAVPSLPPRSHKVPPPRTDTGKPTKGRKKSLANQDTLVPPPSSKGKPGSISSKMEEALRSSGLSLMIPAPVARSGNSLGDGYLSPTPAGGSRPPANQGYLPMDCVDKSAPIDRQRSGPDNYIDPNVDIESHPEPPTHPPSQPPPQPPRRPTDTRFTPEPFNNLLPVPAQPSMDEDDDDYLQLLEDDEASVSGESSIFGDEPLYQIYHRGVVARDVLEGSGEVDSDEEDYISIYEDAETVKNYMSNLLSRGSIDSTATPELLPTSQTSTLETVARLGAGVRKLWSEMPQVVECGVLDTMKPEQRKLQESLFEIITSEASYQKSLKVLVQQFVQAPQLTGKHSMTCVLAIRDQHVLFSNVKAVRDVSAKFLGELEGLWQTNCVLQPQTFCDLLTSFAQGAFDVYVKYCSNQRYQERALHRLRGESSEFRQVLERLERAEACQGLTMQSFLMLPMQRVTRLPLLVDAVAHRMESTDTVYPSVKACLYALQKLVKQCNEGARQMENLEQVTLIDSRLKFKNVKKIAVVSQSRSLVKKGALVWLHRQEKGLLDKLKGKKDLLHLFLFNDLLIITKKKSEEEYSVLEHAPRISVHADIITEEDIPKWLPSGIKGTAKHVFVMVLLEKNLEFILACDSTSERMRWVEAVTPVAQTDDQERIYEDWDCPQVQAIHKYTATEPDELSMEESDVINVSRKMADGWYEGERIRDGERGWFPANHVMEIHSAHIRAKNLRQRYRMLQTAHAELLSAKS